jgi:hypothetical protein
LPLVELPGGIIRVAGMVRNAAQISMTCLHALRLIRLNYSAK